MMATKAVEYVMGVVFLVAFALFWSFVSSRKAKP
jgi:hypothetical protein